MSTLTGGARPSNSKASQRRRVAIAEATLAMDIFPRFEESECVELTPFELDEMDLNNVEQVSKWMYH